MSCVCNVWKWTNCDPVSGVNYEMSNCGKKKTSYEFHAANLFKLLRSVHLEVSERGIGGERETLQVLYGLCQPGEGGEGGEGGERNETFI